MNNKKVVHLSENDIKGGASFYAYRVHKYYSKPSKYSSRMMVLNKYSNDRSVYEFKFNKKKLPNKKLRFFILNKRNKYSFYNYGKYVIDTPKQIKELLIFNPKILIIYNNSNFIHPKIIQLLVKKKIRVYFFLMDMEMITGGCHYNFECEGFKYECNNCPAIKFPFKRIAKENLNTKIQYFKNSKIRFLSPNKNIFRIINKSKIFNKQLHTNRLLHLGIDLKKYKPKKNYITKKRKIIIGLRSSYNPRKGLDIFEQMINHLGKKKSITNKIKFKIIGNEEVTKTLKKNQFKFTRNNHINTERGLIKFYQSIDFFLNTSIGDLGPVMINESLACGTPSLSFNIGVSKDLIKNRKNGYLSNLGNYISMSKIILNLTKLSNQKLNQLRTGSRKTAIKKLDINKYQKIIK